ncbi:MBL fold metallo-hydrolase [Pseudoalteromonas sp. C2R02]|uniref:MBL fold metallo-hydrolase n=1 Tax=Pseudoalteromonas sp. C2R02 TaxID=2841565 RepID=UPI001C094326|nr:MBL fold metallo-hydrolase [Pseudoalteromonas sp. C2R02]MBU2970812.1 MBL fold metallo-hydrolase [Pseudoalteromonas sp. C2R02]
MKILKVILCVLVFIVFFGVYIFNISGNISNNAIEGFKLPRIPASSSKVDVHLLKTGYITVPEAFSMAQGSLFKPFEMVHGAVLVKHGSSSFLFDTGLGKQIDKQFHLDMPFWSKPFMTYKKSTPAVDLIKNNPNLPLPNRIFLSHSHWDHASGLVDFPQANVWISSQEFDYLKTAKPPSVFPSQVNSKSIMWHSYQLNDGAYAGFDRSFDIFNDGSAVIVELSGHSPGSVGLFVNDKFGIRRFFIGDVVWNLSALDNLKRKSWAASLLLDHNENTTDNTILKLKALKDKNPDLKIIPAHDLSAWK